MSKLSSMFKIVTLLQSYGMMSSSELAETLETSTRNIKAYIEAIRIAGVPVEGLSGQAGGYYLSENFKFQAPCLDDYECTALLLTEKILTQNNGFLYANELKTALSKIKQSMKNIPEGFEERGENIFSREKMDISNNAKDKVSLINHAIHDRKRIEIVYSSPIKKEVKKRKVDPYGLVYRNSSWYLIGFCQLRQEVITFKVIRIKELMILKESFEYPWDFSVKKYMENTLDMVSGKEYSVEIQFFHPASIWVSEKLWLPGQDIRWIDDNTIIFSAVVKGLVDVKKWVMEFGRLAKVIRPEKLIEQIKEEINAMKELYSV